MESDGKLNVYVTRSGWLEMVTRNCFDSYSFAVVFAILNLWEAGVKTEDEAMSELKKMRLGLSGAQAESAMSYALKYKPGKWLDKEMVAVSRTK